MLKPKAIVPCKAFCQKSYGKYSVNKKNVYEKLRSEHLLIKSKEQHKWHGKLGRMAD